MTNREVLQRAHKAMDVLSAWDKCTSDFDARAATSRLECELVAIVLDKKNRKHATLLEAARVSLQKEFPSAIMPDTWNEAAPEKKPAAKAKSSATVFRQYDAKGKLTNPKEVMTSLGFNIGVKVQRGDSVGVITAIKDNDDVQLTLEEDGKHKQVFLSVASFIGGEWKQHSEPRPQLEINWLADSPTCCSEFACAVMKAKITAAMFEQCQTLKDWETLQVFTGPKAVKAQKAFQPKKLQVPCATTRVMMVEASKATGDQLIIGNFLTFVVAISGFSKIGKKDGSEDGFQNPFWLIHRSGEADDANMEAGWKLQMCVQSGCGRFIFCWSLFSVLC